MVYLELLGLRSGRSRAEQQATLPVTGRVRWLELLMEGL